MRGDGNPPRNGEGDHAERGGGVLPHSVGAPEPTPQAGTRPLHHSRAASGPPPRTGEDFRATTLHLAGLASALLGWRPAEFWAATPAELATALAPFLPTTDAPDRATLSKLMKDHPDG